jgi:hypothetical protein
LNLSRVAADKAWDTGGVMGVLELAIVLGASAVAALIIYWLTARVSS